MKWWMDARTAGEVDPSARKGSAKILFIFRGDAL